MMPAAMASRTISRIREIPYLQHPPGGGECALRSNFGVFASREKTMSTAMFRNQLLVAIFLNSVAVPWAHALIVGCGVLGPKEVCSGFPTFNNATCQCKANPTIGGTWCVGDGYHSTVNAPMTWTLQSAGNDIITTPLACGFRQKCAATVNGSDGEGCIQPLPGCQFWNNQIIYSSSMHPNLSKGDPC